MWAGSILREPTAPLKKSALQTEIMEETFMDFNCYYSKYGRKCTLNCEPLDNNETLLRENIQFAKEKKTQ